MSTSNEVEVESEIEAFVGAPIHKSETPLPAASSKQIAADISTVVAEIMKVESAWGRLAFEAASGKVGLDDEIARLRQARFDLSERLETLRAIQGHAVEAEKLADRRRSYSIKHSQVRACRWHLAKQRQAATALATALEEAAKQWRVMLQCGAKVQAACPGDKRILSGVTLTVDQVRTAVEIELYRVGGDGRIGNALTFPGARPGDLRFINNPAGLKPLCETIELQHKWLTKQFQQILAGAGEPAAEPANETEPT